MKDALVGGYVTESISFEGKQMSISLMPEFHKKFKNTDGSFNEHDYVRYAKRCNAIASTGIYAEPDDMAFIEDYVTKVVVLEKDLDGRAIRRLECTMTKSLRNQFSMVDGSFDNDRYVKYLSQCDRLIKKG